MTELSFGKEFKVILQGNEYRLEIVFTSLEDFSYSDRDNRRRTFSLAEKLDDWDLLNDLGEGNPIYILGKDSNYYSWINEESQGYISSIGAFHIAIVTRLEIIDCITCEVPDIKIIKF